MPETKTGNDELLSQELADRIKQAIEDKYGTVAQGLPFIEKAIPVSKRTVYKWMDDGQIRLTHIRALASHLDTSVGWLLDGESKHHAQPKRTPDDNVLAFSKQIQVKQVDPALEPIEKTLYMRQVPIIEPDDVVSAIDNNPSQWITSIKEFVDEPKRAHITVSHYEQTVGVPTYAFQVISNWFEPHVRSGEMCAMATDIVPVIGDFVTYAIYDEKAGHYIFAAGFFYPMDFHIDSRRLRDSFSHLDSFILKLKRDGSPGGPGDVEVNPNRFEEADKHPPQCVGVMTYSSYWHSRANREVNTGLYWRVQQAHKMRSMDQNRQQGQGHQRPDFGRE